MGEGPILANPPEPEFGDELSDARRTWEASQPTDEQIKLLERRKKLIDTVLYNMARWNGPKGHDAHKAIEAIEGQLPDPVLVIIRGESEEDKQVLREKLLERLHENAEGIKRLQNFLQIEDVMEESQQFHEDDSDLGEEAGAISNTYRQFIKKEKLVKTLDAATQATYNTEKRRLLDMLLESRRIEASQFIGTKLGLHVSAVPKPDPASFGPDNPDAHLDYEMQRASKVLSRLEGKEDDPKDDEPGVKETLSKRPELASEHASVKSELKKAILESRLVKIEQTEIDDQSSVDRVLEDIKIIESQLPGPKEDNPFNTRVYRVLDNLSRRLSQKMFNPSDHDLDALTDVPDLINKCVEVRDIAKQRTKQTVIKK